MPLPGPARCGRESGGSRGPGLDGGYRPTNTGSAGGKARPVPACPGHAVGGGPRLCALPGEEERGSVLRSSYAIPLNCAPAEQRGRPCRGTGFRRPG